MGGIFINYRRDSARNDRVRALRDRLVVEFGEGQVFFDEKSLDPGTEYADDLRARLGDVEVVLAIIHPGWVRDLKTGGRDWVLEELELALRNRKRVIPLWLAGVEDDMFLTLPTTLDVARRQAVRISEKAWLAEDFTELVAELHHFVRPTWEPTEPEDVRPTPPRPWAAPVAVLLAVLAFAAPFVFPLADGDAIDLGMWSLLLMAAPPIAAGLSTLARRPVRAVEKNVHEMPLRSYYLRVAAPLAVMVVLFTVVSITSGTPSPSVLPVLVLIVIAGTVYVVNLVRKQEKDAQLRNQAWPQRIAGRVGPALVRSELARLDGSITRWPKYRATRELRDRATWHVKHLHAAAGALRTDSERGRWRWLTADHPAWLAVYGLWLGGTLGLFAALSPRALAVAAAVASVPTIALLEITYRAQRHQRDAVADEIGTATNAAAAKLTELSARRR
jgi:hypothetical protein